MKSVDEINKAIEEGQAIIDDGNVDDYDADDIETIIDTLRDGWGRR